MAVRFEEDLKLPLLCLQFEVVQLRCFTATLDHKTSPPIYYPAGRVGPNYTEGLGLGGVPTYTVVSVFGSSLHNDTIYYLER